MVLALNHPHRTCMLGLAAVLALALAGLSFEDSFAQADVSAIGTVNVGGPYNVAVSPNTDKTQSSVEEGEEILTGNMADILASAEITGPNEITIMFTEQLSTFINSYLDFTIYGEDEARNIIGIDGSPSKEVGIRVFDERKATVYATVLTFDGDPVPAGSAGSMYMQYAGYYLASIYVGDGQS
ncbi:MAG: hypothetical protein OXC46_07450 [Thaumarchaeota archaeon]|nr:hypothetical protein [Nitrososphaerota archaeon]